MKSKFAHPVNRHDEGAQLGVDHHVHPRAVVGVAGIKLGGLEVDRQHLAAHEFALEAGGTSSGDASPMSQGTLEVARVEAKIAITKYKDLTPVEETHAFKSMFHAPSLKRDRGTGRPTKKDRRETDDLIGGMFDEET